MYPQEDFIISMLNSGPVISSVSTLLFGLLPAITACIYPLFPFPLLQIHTAAVPARSGYTRISPVNKLWTAVSGDRTRQCCTSSTTTIMNPTMAHLHPERDRTISSSSHVPGSTLRPALPQPSFAPIPIKAGAPIPPAKAGTRTPLSTLYTSPVKHLSLRLASSRSTAYRSRLDSSTSFYLYLPTSHPVSRRWKGDLPPSKPEGSGAGEWDGYGEFKVVVLIHGSVRDAERLRNSWSERAEREGVVIIAPLWAGTLDVRLTI
jgi:hypothetical protein